MTINKAWCFDFRAMTWRMWWQSTRHGVLISGLWHGGCDDNQQGMVFWFQGYDMEDAMTINKASYERGFAHGCIYKSVVRLLLVPEYLTTASCVMVWEYPYASLWSWCRVCGLSCWNPGHDVAVPVRTQVMMWPFRLEPWSWCLCSCWNPGHDVSAPVGTLVMMSLFLLEPWVKMWLFLLELWSWCVCSC